MGLSSRLPNDGRNLYSFAQNRQSLPKEFLVIPRCSDVASDALPVRFDDLFCPPGLTNFLGTLQVGRDPVSIRCFNAPPLFTGSLVTAIVFLDNQFVIGTGAGSHLRMEAGSRRTQRDK